MPKKDKSILTKVQRKTLDAIRARIVQYGQSPTLAELASDLGVELPTVSDRIRGLQKKGYLIKTPHKWRNLEINDKRPLSGGRVIHVPLVASVGADNMTIFALQEFEQFLHVDETLLKGHRDVFAVRAIGNSMRDANIFNGDYVLAEDASFGEVRNGELVIAVIGDMAVVKRIEKGGDVTLLHPENKNGRYHSIIIMGDQEDFEVVGRVVNVLRFSEPEDLTFEYLS